MNHPVYYFSIQCRVSTHFFLYYNCIKILGRYQTMYQKPQICSFY